MTADMQDILDAMPLMFFQKDTENRIVRTNKAAADAVGATVEELVGSNTTDWFPDEAGDYYRDDLEVITTGLPRLGILEQLQVEGPVKHWIRTDKFPHRRLDGDVDGVLVFIHDATAEAAAEELRLNLEEQLRHSQRLEAIGLLAGGVAHDFNNHLMAIMGNAELARHALGEAESGRRQLDTIVEAARMAADLCDQLLTYAGERPSAPRVTCLSMLVAGIRDLATIGLPETASLVFELAPPGPYGLVDETQVAQLVINLISNAADALVPEGGRIVVTTATVEVPPDGVGAANWLLARPPGSYASITVADNGFGMSNAVKDQMFGPFFTTKATGRGLGLATVIGTLHGHGGTIRVRTEPGRGTAVEVLFPLATVAPGNTDRPERAESNEPPPLRPRAGKSVLVVDDDEAVLAVLCAILEGGGYTVIAAPTGSDAIDACREAGGRFTAAVLDIAMPGLDGRETCTQLRLLQPALPVVFSSGHPGDPLVEEFQADSSVSFLRKPYTAAALLAALEQVVQG